MIELVQKIDLEIVKWIQTLRTPFLDTFFELVTQLGDKYFVIILVLVLYWTVDTRKAFDAAAAILVSSAINIGIKEMVQRKRPYDLIHTEFTHTEGYSFPSGHSQNTGTYAFVFMTYFKKVKWIKVLMITLMILVPISRVYLVQHYPSDIIIGLVLGYAIAFLSLHILKSVKHNEHLYALYLIPVAIIALFIRKEIVYVLSGLYIGFALGYFLCKKYIVFDPKNTLIKQLLKVVLGFLVLIGIYYLFKLFPKNHWTQFLKYLIIAFTASFGLPGVYRHVF